MLTSNQIEFLRDLDKIMKKYNIEKFEMHNVDDDCPYVAFYSNGHYFGISDYYHGSFHGIRTYMPSYKVTEGEAPDE